MIFESCKRNHLYFSRRQLPKSSSMEYNIISTILNLSLAAIHLPSQELILINQLNQFFDFDHNIFLVDSTLDPHRYVNILSLTTVSEHGKYTPQSVYIYNIHPLQRAEVQPHGHQCDLLE